MPEPRQPDRAEQLRRTEDNMSIETILVIILVVLLILFIAKRV